MSSAVRRASASSEAHTQHGIGFAQLSLEVNQPVSGGFRRSGDGLGFPCDLCERCLADVIQKLDLDRSVRAVGVDLAEALAAAGTGPDRRVARDVVPAHYSVSPVLEKEFDLGHISRAVDDVDGPLSAYRALARLADNVNDSRVLWHTYITTIGRLFVQYPLSCLKWVVCLSLNNTGARQP